MFRRRFFTQVVFFKHLPKLFTKNHFDIYFRSISLTHYPQNTFFHTIPPHTYVPYGNYVHLYGIYEAILIFFSQHSKTFFLFYRTKRMKRKVYFNVLSLIFTWGIFKQWKSPNPAFHSCCHAIVRALVQIFCPLLSRSQLGCSYWSQKVSGSEINSIQEAMKEDDSFWKFGACLVIEGYCLLSDTKTLKKLRKFCFYLFFTY